MRNRHKYPAEWHDTIRPEILKRDNYKCTECGIRHRQWVVKGLDNKIINIEYNERFDYKGTKAKVYQIILHVCHLDNDKSNCDYSNLKSKCVSCHARLDASFKALLRKSNRVKKQITIFDIINETQPQQQK